jgi:hypothetical protein
MMCPMSQIVDAKNDSGEAQVAELHGEAETVRMSAPLIDDGKVGFAERIVPDQLIICVRQRKQIFPPRQRTGSNGVASVLLLQT